MKRLVHLTDIHYPYCIGAFHDITKPDKETPLFKFLKDFQPHIVVEGGDQMDLGVIAHWNKGKPRLKEGQRLKKEYQGFSKVLDKFERLKSLERHVMLEGNHDNWINMLVDEHPEFEGMLEVQENLDLKSRGIEWIPSRQHLKLGSAYFIHGDYKEGYMPMYTAKAIAGIYGKSVFYGHQHTNQVYAAQTPFDQEPYQVTGVGCLCALNPSWKRNSPAAWLNSFMVMHLDERTGNFYHQVVNIIDGKFVYDGTLYK